MDLASLLKNSIITCIELHVACLLLVVLLYVHMLRSFIRNSRSKEFSLSLIYLGVALMLISDCTWTVVSSLGNQSNVVAYVINQVYFFSSLTAALCWLIFCTKELKPRFSSNRILRFIAVLPYLVTMALYLLSPWFGFIYSIEGGSYVRGGLFFLDPIVKMGYIGGGSVVALICGSRRSMDYLRKNDYNFAFFGIPVLFGGILQTVTGVDFNCLGVTIGLVLIFITGITNADSENTDAIYSLANSYEASYIVNMDTGLIRPLRHDSMHDENTPGMKSMDFSVHFSAILSQILLPEDRFSTLEMFCMENVEKRFAIDNAFSIRYRVRENSGQTSIHTASFIRATGNEGKREFLLGINSIHTDSLLYERSESMSRENARLEQINTSIIESVAKIVEARDSGTGDHIIRVKKLTEILARELMNLYPEYKLDEDRIKLISSASVLHDVGKIVIPDAVLLKPGLLTDDERKIMKTHSAKGCDILNMFPLGLDDAFLECALGICRWHHEKYDGSGYPDGLLGEDIPVAAQIVSVADCFDALVSERPYKQALPPEKAFEMVVSGECGVFSPKIIQAMTNQKSKLMELARLYR